MNISPRVLPLLLLSLGFWTLACGDPKATPQDPVVAETPTAHDGGIAWFKGTVEEAFATAQEENKPLFLYWGAVWCPPCNYLKKTIFTKPEFVEKSRKFVAVYLDGDTDRAQRWGEKLKTIGYPTVLILDPQGEEVMRMAAGMPVEEFNGVLEAAISQLQPLKKILVAAVAADSEPSEADLRMLAFHSWGQDRQVELDPDQYFETFRTLDEKTPESLKVVKSRFLTLVVDEAKGWGDEEPLVSTEDRRLYRDRVVALLKDPETRNANVYFTTFGVQGTIDFLEPELGESRDELLTVWEESLAAFDADESLSVTDHLYGLGASVDLYRAQQGPASNQSKGEGSEEEVLPEELLEKVRAKIAWASEKVQDGAELQSVMNTMSGVMQDAGLQEELEALVRERIGDTKAPYYYMSLLSGLAEEKGNTEEALEWRRKAYEGSEGPNTRFQWGQRYAIKVIDLTPDDLEAVETTTGMILEELLAHDEAFESRNLSRIKQLDKSLSEWGPEGDRQAVVARIRDLVHGRCDQFSAEGEDSLQSRCQAFLAG